MDIMGLPFNVKVTTSGQVAGDMGHGGFVEIYFDDEQRQSDIFVTTNGPEGDSGEVRAYEAKIRLCGGIEYGLLVEALEKTLSFLKDPAVRKEW